MSMAWREILAALGLLAGCGWYGWLTGGLPERSLPNTPGPSFFPLIIVGMAVLLSLAMLIRAAAALRENRDAVRAEGGLSRVGVFMLAAFLGYLALLPIAGFVPSSVAFFATLMVLYGSRNVSLIGAVSIVVPVGLYVVFRYGFQIILPSGPVGF